MEGRASCSLAAEALRRDCQDEGTIVVERASRPLSGETEPTNGLASPLGAVGFFEASTTIGARIDDDPQIVVQGLDLERTLVRAVDQVAGNHPV